MGALSRHESEAVNVDVAFDVSRTFNEGMTPRAGEEWFRIVRLNQRSNRSTDLTIIRIHNLGDGFISTVPLLLTNAGSESLEKTRCRRCVVSQIILRLLSQTIVEDDAVSFTIFLLAPHWHWR